MSFWAVTGVGCIVHATVGEDEGAGCPGVGGAHVQRVGRPVADFPGRVQVVKLAAFLDGCCGLGIVVGEAFVDVAIVDDGPGRGV